MRFARVLEAVYGRVWLITPAAHLSLGRLVQSVYQSDFERRLSELSGLAAALPKDASRGTNVMTRQPLPAMQIRNGTAIIPMAGTMIRGADQIDKSCGMVDVEDVYRDLDEADASDEVRRIILDIDSPGGMHNGATELAARIAASPKETIAWTAGCMCSAAYYAGCSADMVFAAPSAIVGSIGSYIAALDETRALEMAGYKVELFKSGEFKGLGEVGLNDKQREYLQHIVDRSAAQFKGHVAALRPGVDPKTMDGRSFDAAEAYAAGLIDGQANSLADLLKMLTPARR